MASRAAATSGGVAQAAASATFREIILVIGFTVTTEGIWLSQANISEVLRVTAILGIIALGEALVITTGEIDISVGSVFGIVGITFLGLIAPICYGPLLFY